MHPTVQCTQDTNKVQYTPSMVYTHLPPPPKKKNIILNTADRSSGVVFSIASGFLRQKTDLEKTKEVAVTSVLIHILWF